MSCYIHHLPGRLRVRVPGLKGNPAGAAKIVERLTALDGVMGAQANPVTGSVLIRYDTTIANGSECLNLLSLPSLAKIESSRTRVLGGKMAGAVTWYLVEKALERVIERSVPLMLAALI
ncbi:MAG: hypothetical protein M3Z23_14060 [Acidobacteriota bacterium]|nr:hypothetical protein [Acidobacteriota bacterium]